MILRLQKTVDFQPPKHIILEVKYMKFNKNKMFSF